jgi:hypothetical protein
VVDDSISLPEPIKQFRTWMLRSLLWNELTVQETALNVSVLILTKLRFWNPFLCTIYQTKRPIFLEMREDNEGIKACHSFCQRFSVVVAGRIVHVRGQFR